jgi:spore coat polysaccharide biosynthesis protein SpsF
MTLGRTGVIVAARTASSRLPGKALLPLQGVPIVLFLLRRLRPMRFGAVVLATTRRADDDKLARLVESEGIPVFRGAEEDLVARYVNATEHFGFDSVARVTADCPFVDAALVDLCLTSASNLGQFDLATTKGSFPVGLDVEIYPAALMAELHTQNKITMLQREHLTLHFYDHHDEFIIRRIDPPKAWPRTEMRFTVDTQADYEIAQKLAARFDRVDFPVGALLNEAGG